MSGQKLLDNSILYRDWNMCSSKLQSTAKHCIEPYLHRCLLSSLSVKRPPTFQVVAVVITH